MTKNKKLSTLVIQEKYVSNVKKILIVRGANQVKLV